MKTSKHLICLLLSVIMLSLCGCGSQPATQTDAPTTAAVETIDPNTPLSDGKTLKLLAITSSFGKNTTDFLYDIAIAEGCTDVVIGRLYGSGCTLKMHAENAQTNANYYQYTKNNSGRWDQMESIPMLYGLQDEEWDIIFVQQSAGQAGNEITYGNYLDQLMEYIHANKTNPNARFIWNMTWAYQSDSTQDVFVNNFQSNQTLMYNAIVDIVKEKIVPRTDIDRIIPSGTVIQNARTSVLGDTLCRDTYHLNNLGGIMAGYGLYAVLTGQELSEIHLDTATCKTGISGTDALHRSLTDTEKAIIIESVNHAINNPFAVTQSAITENLGG